MLLSLPHAGWIEFQRDLTASILQSARSKPPRMSGFIVRTSEQGRKSARRKRMVFCGELSQSVPYCDASRRHPIQIHLDSTERTHTVNEIIALRL